MTAYVIRRRHSPGLFEYLEDYSVSGRELEFSWWGWDREDAQRFADRERAEFVAGHIEGAEVVPA